MAAYLTNEQVAFFKENGYLIVPDFITGDQADSLRGDCHNYVDKFDFDEHRTIFETTDDQGDCKKRGNEYFLESWDKVRYFFEKDALDSNGKLVVDRHASVNKIGHALHNLWPTYHQLTFDPKVRQIASDLEMIEPRVCQSMYIFKQGKIGGAVTPHQDSTFLWTEPTNRLLAFWVALEDTTLENGCLWFVPKSHKRELGRRFVRNPDTTSSEVLIMTGPPPDATDAEYIAGPVTKGSLVLIDGLVFHKSEQNLSEKSRHIYTWHLVESHGCTWATDNWMQPPNGLEDFPKLNQ